MLILAILPLLLLLLKTLMLMLLWFPIAPNNPHGDVRDGIVTDTRYLVELQHLILEPGQIVRHPGVHSEPLDR